MNYFRLKMFVQYVNYVYKRYENTLTDGQMMREGGFMKLYCLTPTLIIETIILGYMISLLI